MISNLLQPQVPAPQPGLKPNGYRPTFVVDAYVPPADHAELDRPTFMLDRSPIDFATTSGESCPTYWQMGTIDIASVGQITDDEAGAFAESGQGDAAVLYHTCPEAQRMDSSTESHSLAGHLGAQDIYYAADASEFGMPEQPADEMPLEEEGAGRLDHLLLSLDDDEKIVSATMKAFQSGTLTPLIKEELRCTIQSRRLAQGKDELQVEFKSPPKKKDMTDEERKRAVKRRQQNREAAQRFRQKQKDTSDYLTSKIKRLETSSRKLMTDLKRLRNEKNELQMMLSNHLLVCMNPLRETLSFQATTETGQCANIALGQSSQQPNPPIQLPSAYQTVGGGEDTDQSCTGVIIDPTELGFEGGDDFDVCGEVEVVGEDQPDTAYGRGGGDEIVDDNEPCSYAGSCYRDPSSSSFYENSSTGSISCLSESSESCGSDAMANSLNVFRSRILEDSASSYVFVSGFSLGEDYFLQGSSDH